LFHKPQRKFLLTLLSTIFVVCGKVNYTNLSRYSELSEKTYRRHYQQGYGFEGINQVLISQVSPPEQGQIAAVDCTFVAKSGRCTYGLDWFYNGKTQRAERGLEWSVIAIIDLEDNSGYSLSAQQTPAELQQQAKESAGSAKPPGNRID
jgi:hypothetical protein